MRKLIIHIAFCLCFSAASAQEKDTVVVPDTVATLLKVVKITTTNTGEGLKRIKFDAFALKTHQGKTLADILQNSGTVYVRQYAPGQLSTVSMRGSNASQVQLLWNGFNLNNLSLGQTDFSLVPVSLFSDITVNMGAMGATGGNGVVAGSVEIGSTSGLSIQEKTLLQAGVQVGSFGKYAAGAAFSQRVKQHVFSLKPFYSRAANRFTYTDVFGKTAVMEHAGSEMYGLLASYGYRFNRSYLGTDVWLQESNRNIPATLFESRSFATQQDRSLKISTRFIPYRGIINIVRLGYFYDELNYENNLFNKERSGFKVHNIIGETEAYWRKYSTTHKVKLFVSGATADNTGYASPEKLFRGSIGYFFTWRDIGKKPPFNLTANIKQEINNSTLSVPVAQLGLSTQYVKSGRYFLHAFSFNLNAGTVYRFPTLNDLYWYPGGNPDLKPEKGGTAQTMGEWEMATARVGSILQNIRIGFTHYQRYMYDLIMWMPRGTYWSPQNMQEVWSRGNETTIQVIFGEKYQVFTKGLFNYTVSTIQKSELPNDQSIGRQLIYTPMYNATAELGMMYKGFSLSGTAAYYGYRYTSSDNYEYLDPFYLVGARLAYTKNIKSGIVDVFATAENLLDETYYWIAQRPALPRNFNIGLSFKWIKKKEQKVNN